LILTDNYSLKKPNDDDFYDIGIHNGNMDIIDNIMRQMDIGKQEITKARNSFVKADSNGVLVATNINKGTVGLERVDNTKDIDKPLSRDTRNEINNSKNGLQRNINGVQNNINSVNNSLNSFKNQIHYEQRKFNACLMSEAGGEWPGHTHRAGEMMRIGNMIFATFSIICRPPGNTSMPLLIGGFPYKPRFGGGTVCFQDGWMPSVGFPRQFTLQIGGSGNSFYIRHSNSDGRIYDVVREGNLGNVHIRFEGYVMYFI